MAGRRQKGCGTRAGYLYHKRHRTAPCEQCVVAYRRYIKEYNAERRARRGLDPVTEVALDALGRRTSKWKYLGTLEPRADGWKEFKACGASTAHLFHSSDPTEITEAIRICRGCAVADDCLDEQQFYQAPGVWAGVRWVPKPDGLRMKADSRFVKEYVGVA